MKLPQIDLRILLTGTIGLLSLLVISVSGVMALNAWKQGQAAGHVAENSEVTDALLEAGRQLIGERDATAVALLAMDRSTANSSLQQLRAKTAATWRAATARAEAEHAEHGGGNGAMSGHAKMMQDSFDKLMQLRARVDAELSLPMDERDPAVVRSWNAAAGATRDHLYALWVSAGREAAAIDPVARQYAELKGFSFLMADYAGRETAVVAGAIAEELPMSPRQLRILFDYRGRVELAWDTLKQAADDGAVDPAVKAAVDGAQDSFIEKFGAARNATYGAGISAQSYPLTAQNWLEEARAGIESIDRLRLALLAANRAHTDEMTASANATLALLALLLGLAVATTAASFMIVSRRVIKPIVELTGTTGLLAGGDMETQIPGRDRRDEIGDMARSLEQIRALGVAAARSQAGLNDASSAVLMTDLDGTVIFANKAMRQLHGQLSEALSTLPGFTAPRIVGQRFADLHDIAALGAANLANLERQIDVQMIKGGHTVDLKVGPVRNDQGERLGVVVEWNDRSQEVAIESEVSGIVTAAAQGVFSKRLDEDGKAGFMLELSKGMNELVETVDRGLTETVEVMSGLAGGDLTKRMTGAYQGSFQRLKDDVNRTSDQLRQIAGQIVTVSASVDGATGEIASGVTDLSTRTEHQASSLEETTASMEELSATVRQNADNAQEANQVAAAARDSAASGGEVVSNAVAAMSRIEDSSKQITDIVGLIQEIAFQTNLLALNAAVEAARAGDAGKGFAVVANEVRALAQRSGQASKDIKNLITNSDNQVKEGVELVNKAGASLEEIVGSVKKVADFVAEIAAASQEQSSGIDQVSRAINSMEEMTQQNGALVEETTGALQSAQSQVGSLRDVVTFFKTGEAATMMSAPEPETQDVAIDHPVHRQQSTVRRAVAGSGAAAAVAIENDNDWQEF